MTVKSSGSSLSFSEISAEFGTPPGKNLGAYRVSQTVSGLSNLALDNEVNNAGIVTALIPQSGQIKFSDFYSKKLNVVIDYTSAIPAKKATPRIDYDSPSAPNNARVVVIGNFKSRPPSPAGTKVWIHTNSDLGSDRNSTTTANLSRVYCSLLTGVWEPTTDLRIDVGPNGKIVGAGGDGGNGGNATSSTTNPRNAPQHTLTPGQNGANGTTAIGIQHSPVIVTNRGLIQNGCGGGGGGGSGFGYDRDRNIFNQTIGRQSTFSSGSGGGGGQGYPAGNGGLAGIVSPDIGGGSYYIRTDAGSPGITATFTSGGNGGNGNGLNSASSSDSAAGAGGGGVSNGIAGTPVPGYPTTAGTNATSTQGGSGGRGYGKRGSGRGGSSDSTAGGIGGLNGYAIVVFNNGTGVTIPSNIPVASVQYNTTPQ